ncbi:MAG: 50S ribosome-binding GTPase [Candidatus Zixiibacteriota bacterium]|nr:MAG: 50S ribosome-binding GTPase [candidate division Zixibacteria bacterium]
MTNKPVNNILITAYPGVGKTTLIRRLMSDLSDYQPVGFFTQEIREGGVRVGFGLTSHDGRQHTLSHVSISGGPRVGKYGVDIAGFETFLTGIDFFSPPGRLIMIDEIGKMECLSKQFQRLLPMILDSAHVVIASIALKGTGLISGVKQRSDVTVRELTRSGADKLAREIVTRVQKLLS